MLFFRSEEQIQAWCTAHQYPMQPAVTITQLWAMATTWYSSRLEENARRPQPEEIRGIFSNLGLTGDFWDPQSDNFN